MNSTWAKMIDHWPSAILNGLPSAVIDTKTTMLEAHQSQLTWLRDHDGVDVVEQMRTVSRFRGLQCGVEYAEGFVPCLTWLRPTTSRLLP